MDEAVDTNSWCSLRVLQKAARECARRKHARPDAIAFRVQEGEEILALADRLASGTYVPEPGRVFVTERPKYREVHAAAYRDRVVHHLLHDLLEPIFEPRMSEATFACRKGKGTHAAAGRLQERMWDLSRHGGIRLYALSMDVVNFFMSLYRPTLIELLRPHVGNHPAWPTIERLIRHDHARTARPVCPRGLFRMVPPHKRLGALGPDRGLPIGNLTSQFFANVYLSPLDHFVQRTLGIRGYVRYVDDFVLLDPSQERLAEAAEQIVVFLCEKLSLAVRARPIRAVSQGVDFVGYIVRPRYLLPRRRVVRQFEAKLAELDAKSVPIVVPHAGGLRLPGLGRVAGPLRCTRIDEATCERARAIWASYEGHLAKASAWRLRARIWRRHPGIHGYLRRTGGRIGRRFALVRPCDSFRAQVARLSTGIAPGGARARTVLVLKVGRFAQVAGGRGRPGVRRGRRSGVLWRFAGSLVRRILDAGHPVAVALEQSEWCGNVKRRHLAYLFEPMDAETKEEEL